jgi:uncharacterized SAM-binding protein YcdF (DUF218 family)
MFFEVSKILWWFLQPSKLWLLLVTLGVLLLYSRQKNLGRSILSFAVVIVFLTVFLPVHTWVAGTLETRFPRLTELPTNVDGIVVLGGAVDQLITARFGQASLNDGAERMTETVALARRYPTARVVFTGGTALTNASANSPREADVARLLFENLGVEESRVVLESESRNTWENAVNTKALVNPQPNEVWLLVTSAQHMPRSIGIFRKVAWNVIPYPTDYRVIPGKRQPNMGFPEKLQIIDSAAKEWIGLVSYYFMGRTSAVFPRP